MPTRRLALAALALLAAGAGVLAWRATRPAPDDEAEVRALGCRYAVDDRILASPSSTDFRASRHVTIVFPTDEVLSRLELLFRYGMNQSWMFAPPPAPANPNQDFEI